MLAAFCCGLYADCNKELVQDNGVKAFNTVPCDSETAGMQCETMKGGKKYLHQIFCYIDIVFLRIDGSYNLQFTFL